MKKTKERFVRVTKEEFDEVMSEYLFALTNPSSTDIEYVYSLCWGNPHHSSSSSDADWQIKVYSSVTPKQGGRDKGEDAIRVVLLVASPHARSGLFPVWKAPRVYRVKGWQDRLRERVEEALWRGLAHDPKPYCPACKSALHVRDVKSKTDPKKVVSQFIGCSGWKPGGGCTYTRNIP